MSTDNIKLFIQANYSDSQLAALIAHTESGRLSYRSCCCLVGIPTAPHALVGVGNFCYQGVHLREGQRLPFGLEAEPEFRQLGGPEDSDHLRRERLLPILYAEVERREQERDVDRSRIHVGISIPEPVDYEDAEEYWTDGKGMAEMVNSIKGR